MCLNVRFICIETREKTILFTCKNSWRLLRAKQNCLRIGVYCMQKNRLGNTVPTHQTISWSKLWGRDILQRSAQIWRFGLVQLFFELFWRYLCPKDLDQLIVCCVGTVVTSLFKYLIDIKIHKLANTIQYNLGEKGVLRYDIWNKGLI